MNPGLLEMCLALASYINFYHNNMKRTLGSSSLSLAAGCDPSGLAAVNGFALIPAVVSLVTPPSSDTPACPRGRDDACPLLSLFHFCTNTNNYVRVLSSLQKVMAISL